VSMSAAKTIDAASPTLTEPMSDSDTSAGMTMFVMSESVMNPLLLLTLDVELVVEDEPVDAVVPVDAVLDVVVLEVVLEDATDAEPGVDPTTPLTVITVAAIGDVNVQSPKAVCAVVSAVCAEVTALAGWVVDACACVRAVFALATCCSSLSVVLASEFLACVTEDRVCELGAVV
jgi:hypothetical protein